ncbi:MAG: Sec-independent protein translocase protein TatB [Xanthomonadales bacterium]|nr:Sec-independent protein translocase protein TatB [Xanthomonadales bacterium]
MFDVGFAEIFLLALIGLLVLGPERLPGVARTVGGFVRKARMSWVSLRNTIESELAEADISAPIKKTSEELKQIGRDLTEASAFKSETPKTDHPKTDDDKSETTGPDPVSAEASKPEPLPEPDSKKPENV